MISFSLLFLALIAIIRRPMKITDLHREINQYNVPQLDEIKIMINDILSKKESVENKLNLISSRIDAIHHG